MSISRTQAVSSIRRGLSPFLSVGTGASAVLPDVWQRQHPGAQAHDGSIGQPLEQGREEKPGLVRAAGNLFTLYLCGEVR